jgi:hypothetical protein
MRSLRKPIAAITVVVAALAGVVGAASAHPNQLEAVKRSLVRFHSVSFAKRNGFALVTDVNGVSCIDGPRGQGNMGYHYANGALLTDGKIDRFHPEAALYESTDDGLRLTAIEYIVLKADWKRSRPPELFGEGFMLVRAGNRFGLPAFYMLHVWLWKDNPSGLFNPFNPRVSCP